VIVCVDFDWEKSQVVLAYQELERAPLPTPGQKKEIYTFRIYDVPVRHKAGHVADLVLEKILAQKGRPGVDYNLAYNISWERVRDGSIVSDFETVTSEKACEILGMTWTKLRAELSDGRVASTRPPQSKTGNRPHVFNKADLDYYLAHKKPRGRPPKRDA
jgi:hypothetical protein